MQSKTSNYALLQQKHGDEMRPIYIAILALLGIAAAAIAGAAYLTEKAREEIEKEAKIYA